NYKKLRPCRRWCAGNPQQFSRVDHRDPPIAVHDKASLDLALVSLISTRLRIWLKRLGVLDLGDWQGVSLAAHTHDHGCLERQTGGQSDRQPGAPTGLGLEVDGPLLRTDFTGHHVHTHAAAGDLADVLLG